LVVRSTTEAWALIAEATAAATAARRERRNLVFIGMVRIWLCLSRWCGTRGAGVFYSFHISHKRLARSTTILMPSAEKRSSPSFLPDRSPIGKPKFAGFPQPADPPPTAFLSGQI